MKRVFLVFAQQDKPKVKKLIALLVSPEYELDIYDGQLDINIELPQAQQIKRLIGEKIIKCGITLCLISQHTHADHWVDLELSRSRNKGNRIIAMALKGTLDAVLPRVIREENLKFYPWDPQRLKSLISEDTAKLFNNSL
jgi:hypothetical protein